MDANGIHGRIEDKNTLNGVHKDIMDDHLGA